MLPDVRKTFDILKWLKVKLSRHIKRQSDKLNLIVQCCFLLKHSAHRKPKHIRLSWASGGFNKNLVQLILKSIFHVLESVFLINSIQCTTWNKWVCVKNLWQNFLISSSMKQRSSCLDYGLIWKALSQM